MVAQKTVFVACLFFISGLCVVLADKEVSVENVTVKVLGQSAKISVRQKNKNETYAIVITMEDLEELDSNGTSVGQKGRRKHTFKNFANQNFVLSNVKNSTYKGLKCLTFSSTGFLVGPNSNFTVVYYIFKENGEIDIGENETAEVVKGSLKWNIQIENWEFCGPGGDNCTKGRNQEVGESLSFSISVKSRRPPERREREKTTKRGKKTLLKFGFGEEGNMYLSNEVKRDGQWVPMMEGFPKFEVKGNKQVFTFRFPKFENTSFYDPTYSQSTGDEGSTTTTTTNTTTNTTTTTPTEGSAASHIYPLSYAFLAIAMVLGAFIDLFN